MIDCGSFYQSLTRAGFQFYTGVPDSLLKNFCYFVEDSVPADRHVITANEGGAIGLASGYHMATGKIAVVYLQNSGLGNTINPLLSIADPDVYSLPMLLMVGWRGEPGVKDEPQHKKQGRVMLEMLESMETPFEVIDADTDVDAAIARALEAMARKPGPYVFAVKDGTFSDYAFRGSPNDYSLRREQAIDTLLGAVAPDDIVVCTTGKASRELYELRERRGEGGRADFLTVGGMGHCSQIALGVALQRPDRAVFCFDGDGAALMHMGGLATIGRLAPANFIHVMINNGAHESVGGQATGAFGIDWPAVARACGYRSVRKIENPDRLAAVIAELPNLPRPAFLEVRAAQGSRKELGRPKTSPSENKQQFQKALGL